MAVLVLVSATVVAGLALVNSQAPPPPPLLAYGVTLGRGVPLAAENRQLAREGARVRVVPLTRACRSVVSLHPSHLTRVDLKKVRGYVIDEAPAGDTTVAVVFRHALTGFSLQMQGRAPACLPLGARGAPTISRDALSAAAAE